MSEKSALTLLFVYRAIINRQSGLTVWVLGTPESNRGHGQNQVPLAGQVASGQDQNQVAEAAVATGAGQSHAGVSVGEPEDGEEDEENNRQRVLDHAKLSFMACYYANCYVPKWL